MVTIFMKFYIYIAENGTIFMGNLTEKRNEESRIVNGTKATENQFPFMVKKKINSKSFSKSDQRYICK